ncbi:helix-turn-helix domain-containing protein [Streptomyces griseus]|uniref:helix-turn-helix domain-containing protein n=1 Tax=Streptomyces griseus TaxID=1911 RepID=UPI00083FF0E8|nr:helix-turn-helix domain-containing protein [Streptomyces griseus]
MTSSPSPAEPDPGATLRRLLAYDDAGTLRLLVAPAQRDVAVRAVVFGDEGAGGHAGGHVVLAVGPSAACADATEAVREAARSGACAVVLRETEGAPAAPEVLAAAAEAGVALLARAAWTDWSDTAALLRSALALAAATTGDPGADAHPYGDDLDALAAAIAARTGGSITIEDTSFRVLAHSATLPEADGVRRSTILGGRVPEWRIAELRRSGVLRALWTSRDVIRRPADGDSPERLVVAVRNGPEVLGSIWAAADGRSLSLRAGDALRRAAEAAAPLLVRHRLRESGAVRRRDGALRGLLYGQGDGRTHAWSLGLAPEAPCAVVIAEPAGAPGHGVRPEPVGGTQPPHADATPSVGGTTPPVGGTTPPVGGTTPPVGGASPFPDPEPGTADASLPHVPEPSGAPPPPEGPWTPAFGTWSGIRRTLDALALQALSYRSGVLVLREAERLLVLFPLRGGGQEREVLGLARELAGLASALPGGVPVRAGAGCVVPSAVEAAASREEAALVVRVLRERERRGGPGPALRHAGPAEAGPGIDVLRALDAVRPLWEAGTGPVHDLVRSDLTAGGVLVRSLAAYLDASGDVVRAARRLVVHPNTLRYRLRRVRERFGVDLDDPDTRLLLTLAVRLAGDT